MPGNHDAWLCPFYQSELGAQIVPDPYELTIYGLRLHVVHGHLLGARRAWKALMESHAFFAGFGRVPLRWLACSTASYPGTTIASSHRMKNGTSGFSATTHPDYKQPQIWSSLATYIGPSTIAKASLG